MNKYVADAARHAHPVGLLRLAWFATKTAWGDFWRGLKPLLRRGGWLP